MSTPSHNNDSIISLLDLLAGWGAYAEDPDDLSDEDRAKPDVIADIKAKSKAEDIGRLYQEAGEMAVNDPSDDQIIEFIITKVIPLVLSPRKAP